MSDQETDKAAARTAAFARRKAAKSSTRDAKATACLLAALSSFKGRAIAGYMPILTEVDPLPAMAAMASFGHVCVPVIQKAGLPLLFRQWVPGCKMMSGPFGAMVPVEGNWIVPEIVIVPLVAFDDEGGRLGYGGGFYDRTLEGLRAAGSITAYGFAFAAQRAAHLPQEPTDQKLDGIITERGLIRFA